MTEVAIPMFDVGKLVVSNFTQRFVTWYPSDKPSSA